MFMEIELDLPLVLIRILDPSFEIKSKSTFSQLLIDTTDLSSEKYLRHSLLSFCEMFLELSESALIPGVNKQAVKATIVRII